MGDMLCVHGRQAQSSFSSGGGGGKPQVHSGICNLQQMEERPLTSIPTQRTKAASSSYQHLPVDVPGSSSALSCSAWEALALLDDSIQRQHDILNVLDL